MNEQFHIQWIDHGAEPTQQPNPDYPDGTPILMLRDETKQFCETDLPYPAKRIGLYVIRCKLCGFCIALTTAGRADDPLCFAVSCDKIKRA